MRIVLLGAPGAGKGTQAEVISREKNIPTISTGNIIRDALKVTPSLGRKPERHEAGHLVPDDIVRRHPRVTVAWTVKTVSYRRLSANHPQAEALERMGRSY